MFSGGREKMYWEQMGQKTQIGLNQINQGIIFLHGYREMRMRSYVVIW